MNLPFIPWFDIAAMQMQRAAEVAWFVYGCAEREQRLNADAWFAWWTGGSANPPWLASWPGSGGRLALPGADA